MSGWYSRCVSKSRDEVWEDLEEDFWRLSGWNADQNDVDSIRNKIDQYLAAEDGAINALTDDMVRAKERAAFQRGAASGYKEGKDEALKNAVFTDLPYAVREKIILDHAAAEEREYERGRRDGGMKAAFSQDAIDRQAAEKQAARDAGYAAGVADGTRQAHEGLTVESLPDAERARLAGERQDAVDLAFFEGRREGYADGRKNLVFDDLPEEERRRIEGLRVQADQAGYVRGYNEGVAKGKLHAASVAGREYLPADAVPGSVLQGADGGVWIHIGAPKQLPRESTPRVERPPVTVVTAQSLGSVAPDKRKCRACQEIKDLETEFYRDSRGQQGRKTICKACDEKRKREYKKMKKAEAEASA